jgi:S-adenosylmethionine:tRNA ribosyltransferase-isomerase
MNLDAFDFNLPDDRIAVRPARPRDSARLLVVRGPDGRLEDCVVRDLPDLLSPGDLLVANDSRVAPAALSARRPPRAPGAPEVALQLNLNRREGPDTWTAFIKPGRRVKTGDRLDFAAGLTAGVEHVLDAGEFRLRFDRGGPDLDAAIAEIGATPLPPYIASKRAPDAQDKADYQTIYAREAGSVAAPTAGLHFTEDLMARLALRGVAWSSVTLHVNAGTFLPVKADTLAGHRMHAEWIDVPEAVTEAIGRTRRAGRRVIAVGTTSLRSLETAARMGDLAPFRGESDIFITPGHRFRAIDGLMTNFHLPRSTLFVLVSALMGVDVMQRAYRHAIDRGYRFYSYGDACLLLPHG